MNDFSYINIQKDILGINASIESRLSMAKELESVFGPYRQHQQFLDEMTHLARANQAWISAYNALRVDTSQLEWVRNIQKRMVVDQAMIEKFKESASLLLGGSSNITAIAESIRSQLDFTKFNTTYGLNESVTARYAKRMEITENSFARLASSFSKVSDFALKPLSLMPSASREMLVSEWTIAELTFDEELAEKYEVSISDIQEETPIVCEKLEMVNLDFAVAYKGAIEALQSKHTDYKRHVLVSLREMWDNLLRILASDDLLEDWIRTNLKYSNDGKPTRKARIDYLCREINYKPLSSFLLEDTKAFLEMYNLFSRLHNLNSGLTDEKLWVLIHRSNSWLKIVLDIHENSN